MANTLGDMVVRIVGDATGLDKTLTTSQKKMAAFAVNAAAVVAVAVQLGKTFAKVVTSVAEYGSTIDDASMRTGLSTDAIQEYKYIAEQVGTTLESVTGAVGMMTRGLDTNKAKFAELGVQLNNADGSFRTTTEIFNDTISKLSSMSDETERDKMAFQLLGRSAQTLIPILKQGAGGIESLKKEAYDLGIILDEKAIKNADALGDSLLALKSSARGLGQALITDITPALNNLVRGLTDFISNVLNTKKQLEAFKNAQSEQPKTLTDVRLALSGVNTELKKQRALLKSSSNPDRILNAQTEIARLEKMQTGLKSLEKELRLIESHKPKSAPEDAPILKITETPEEIQASTDKINEYLALLSAQRAGFQEAADDRINQENEIHEAVVRGYEERARLIEEEKQKRTEAYKYIYSQIDSIMDGVYANEIARIENSELSEEEKAKKIAQIKRKQAIWDKAQSVADIAIQTALAITKALPNIFLAAAIGALGAAQAAVALSTPLPPVPSFAEGGIVNPQPGGTLATVAEAGVAEAIIPLDRLEKMMGDSGGQTHLVVNLDSKPLLDTIFSATRDRRVLISAGAVV